MQKNTESISFKVQPFLKWAGGKRWFVTNYRHLIPPFVGSYVEPFLGSGAVFFHLLPEKSILSDANKELIDTYKAIKNNPQGVTDSLLMLKKTPSFDYYAVRRWQPKGLEEKAARFIYLNRTCWNALWRVNLKGEFNVPKGSRDINSYPEDNFGVIAGQLKGAKLVIGDFEKSITKAKKGDFIFADPPYTVRHNFNGFVKYNENIFSWADQERLAASLIQAHKRGASIIHTNAQHESIKNLYKDSPFTLIPISRYSSIASNKANRSHFGEYIITNCTYVTKSLCTR